MDSALHEVSDEQSVINAHVADSFAVDQPESGSNMCSEALGLSSCTLSENRDELEVLMH